MSACLSVLMGQLGFNNVLRKSFRLWDRMEKHGRARLTADDNIRAIRHFACWIPKATDPHREYVIFFAFPRQQCFRELASVLHLYIFCLSCSLNTASLQLTFRNIISRAVFKDVVHPSEWWLWKCLWAVGSSAVL
jgi:hypothetical protein